MDCPDLVNERNCITTMISGPYCHRYFRDIIVGHTSSYRGHLRAKIRVRVDPLVCTQIESGADGYQALDVYDPRDGLNAFDIAIEARKIFW